MSLTPAHLRTLSAIARYGSFSRAAESLNLSQPAVSHQIRLLEQDLGTPLLDRVGKRAFPTRAGEILLAHGARALAELDAARSAIHDLRGRVAGRVRLGTGATASIYMLPPMLQRLQRRYPNVEVVVVTGNSSEIAGTVEDGQLDLGVVTLPVPQRDLVVTPFRNDPLVAIAPPGTVPRRRRVPPPRSRNAGHRARAHSLTPRELARERLIVYERRGTIRRIVEDWFRRGGVAPRIAMELGNAEAIKRLVAAGLGFAVTSAVSVQEDVKRGAIVSFALRPALNRRIGIVLRRGKVVSPALDVVLKALRSRPR